MLEWVTELKPSEWVTIAATLLGPILAVQAQKAVESLKQLHEHKLNVYRTLMSTRAHISRTSVEHVRALNFIDLAFYGRRLFWTIPWQTEKEKTVIESWKLYLDVLSIPVEQMGPNWLDDRDARFVTLLNVMGNAVGFSVGELEIKRGVYSPQIHSDVDAKQGKLLDSAIAVLSGDQALKMNIMSFPVDPESAAAHKLMIQQMVQATASGKLEVKHEGPL
jgi:hypothetical protein